MYRTVSQQKEVPEGLEGLSSDAARARLAEFGPNRWVAAERWARLREFVRLLLDPMAVMLAVAATVYLLLGETQDALVLALALIPVLGVDVALEARSRAALARLAAAAAPSADVVRDGRVCAVPVSMVVPGDLLVLREGHMVAADGVVLWASNLSLDESALTGESAPQAASLDARVYAGSPVLTGQGFARVTATGTSTEYGHIAALVAHTAPTPSPLQRRANHLVRALGTMAVGVAVGIFLLGLARGQVWTDALLGAVSLSMAAIPEEFPVVLTLFLSVGAWRLAARGMLVRRLASVEALGSTTVICTDKTGTLTKGQFEVVAHVTLEAGCRDTDLFESAVLACEVHPVDAMELAIAAYADAQGVSVQSLRSQWQLVRDYPFDPVGKHMSHVWKHAQASGSFVVAAKGAIEGVMAHASVGHDQRQRVTEAHQDLAARGLRVLAIARKHLRELGADREKDEDGLELIGLLGFADPLRPEVRQAVTECDAAGIRIKLITGDHALTAHAVATAAGIRHDDEAILTGDRLEVLPEPERLEHIDRAAIFARTSPAQKYLIVDALRESGEIVAMTGDGVNDAPALRRADIGIAMGQRGTDVARATADLVLLDDNFASIVATIREGRHIFQNIQRAFLYLIAFHVPIVSLAVLAPLAGVPLVLLPIHLVWLELIVHPVSALVFQAEPAAATIMAQPPRAPNAPMLPLRAIVRSVLAGLALAVASFGVYWVWWPSRGEAMARGLALVTLLAGYQVLMFVERRALNESALPPVPRSVVFWVTWGLTGASVIAVLAVPPVARLFHVSVPHLPDALLAAALGIAAVVWRFVPAAPAR